MDHTQQQNQNQHLQSVRYNQLDDETAADIYQQRKNQLMQQLLQIKNAKKSQHNSSNTLNRKDFRKQQQIQQAVVIQRPQSSKVLSTKFQQQQQQQQFQQLQQYECPLQNEYAQNQIQKQSQVSNKNNNNSDYNNSHKESHKDQQQKENTSIINKKQSTAVQIGGSYSRIYQEQKQQKAFKYIHSTRVQKEIQQQNLQEELKKKHLCIRKKFEQKGLDSNEVYQFAKDSLMMLNYDNQQLINQVKEGQQANANKQQQNNKPLGDNFNADADAGESDRIKDDNFEWAEKTHQEAMDLLQKKQTLKCLVHEIHNLNQLNQCSFQPKITKMASQIRSPSIIEKTQQHQVQQQIKDQQKRIQFEQQQQIDEEQRKAKGRASFLNQDKLQKVYERQMAWKRRVDQNIENATNRQKAEFQAQQAKVIRVIRKNNNQIINNDSSMKSTAIYNENQHQSHKNKSCCSMKQIYTMDDNTQIQRKQIQKNAYFYKDKVQHDQRQSFHQNSALRKLGDSIIKQHNDKFDIKKQVQHQQQIQQTQFSSEKPIETEPLNASQTLCTKQAEWQKTATTELKNIALRSGRKHLDADIEGTQKILNQLHSLFQEEISPKQVNSIQANDKSAELQQDKHQQSQQPTRGFLSPQAVRPKAILSYCDKLSMLHKSITRNQEPESKNQNHLILSESKKHANSQNRIFSQKKTLKLTDAKDFKFHSVSNLASVSTSKNRYIMTAITPQQLAASVSCRNAKSQAPNPFQHSASYQHNLRSSQMSIQHQSNNMINSSVFDCPQRQQCINDVDMRHQKFYRAQNQNNQQNLKYERLMQEADQITQGLKSIQKQQRQRQNNESPAINFN